MEQGKYTYFNFPICLIDGIFADKRKVLNDIFDYAVYAKAISLKYGNKREKIKSAEKYFGVRCGDITLTISNGKKLWREISNTPKTSIKKNLFFDYYENEKIEFELAVFCAYCAIRSILLFKPYCKITDNYMLARMAGRAKNEIENLPEPLKKYQKRYHLDKLKKELAIHWNLKLYGRHTRGFYVSFQMDLTDLIFQIEKKRKKYLEKKYQKEIREARQQAVRRLCEPTAP